MSRAYRPSRAAQNATDGYTPAVIPVSAALITLDEERNIGPSLESVAFCDEIVVVDAGSSDRTLEIARAAGARIVQTDSWPGFVAQKNRALDEARHDWVLSVDADERVSAKLRMEVEHLRAHGFDSAGYRVPRVAYYLGRWLRGTDWYPDYQLRLMDRRRGRWDGAYVHESPTIDGRVRKLRGELEHLPYADIAEHLETIDRYTTLWAKQAHEAGERSGPIHMTAVTLFAFLRNYVLRGGLRFGTPGLVVSGLNTFYTFTKMAKLVELQREMSRKA